MSFILTIKGVEGSVLTIRQLASITIKKCGVSNCLTHHKPLYIKPDLGNTPSFFDDHDVIGSLGTTAKFKRALDAIRNGKKYVKGAVNEYSNSSYKNCFCIVLLYF